jgi:hypothetical protein
MNLTEAKSQLEALLIKNLPGETRRTHLVKVHLCGLGDTRISEISTELRPEIAGGYTAGDSLMRSDVMHAKGESYGAQLFLAAEDWLLLKTNRDEAKDLPDVEALIRRIWKKGIL